MTSEKAYLEELHVRINGVDFNPQTTSFRTGDFVEAHVSKEAFDKYGGLYVIKTPLAKYVPDFKAIAAQDGATVCLGDIPTIFYRNVQNAEFSLDDNTLYDLFYIHNTSLDPVRLTTGAMPNRLTLDEVKLMIAFNTGFKPEELGRVKATVIYDPLHLRNRMNYLYYGIQVGEIVANISTQHPLGMYFTARRGDIGRDFLETPTAKMMADEIRKLK